MSCWGCCVSILCKLVREVRYVRKALLKLEMKWDGFTYPNEEVRQYDQCCDVKTVLGISVAGTHVFDSLFCED